MASLTFPSSPSNGDTYSYDGLTYVYNSTKNKWSVQSTTTITGISADSIGTSLTPSANVTYDLGTSAKSFRDLYLSGSTIHLGSQQISSNSTGVILPEGSLVGTSEIGSGSGVTVYANASILPTTGLTSGEMAYTGNAIFITNGSGWYRIAVVNQDPTITLSESSISLGASGNTVFFTYTTSDPDGTTPTVTLSNSGIANTSVANVNLYTANNTVRVDNFSATDWEGIITLTASDGISTGFDSLTVSVAYLSEYWNETLLSIDTNSTNSLDNSTFIDRSTNSYTVTTSGTPTQTAFHPYLDNWSVEFDGTDDYLTFADNSNWDFVNSGDFTVDFWMNSRTTSNFSTFGQSGGGGSRPDKWGLYFNDVSVGLSSGTIGWHLGSNGNIQGPSITINANQWYHIQVSRSGDTWYFFQDGTLLGTASSTTRPSTAAAVFVVGADGESYRDFNGFISNFRVVKGTNLNTSSFTSPTEKLTAITNTVLLTCQSNRFADNSTNGYAPSVVGTPKISAFNPFGQGSEYAVGANKGSTLFDGSGTRLSTSLIELGSSNYTVEAWIYLTTNTTNGDGIISKGTSGNVTNNFYSLEFTSTNVIRWFVREVSNSTFVLESPSALSLHTWYHIAVVRNGSAHTMYINGVSVDTSTNSYTMASGGDVMYIGTGWYETARAFNGYISDARISTTAQYTSNFTPTSPVGNTNADLYLPMDNAGIYDKTGNHTLKLINNTETSTTKTKYATTSIRVASASDYLITDGLAMGGWDDVTIEGWFNFDFTNSNVYIAGHDTTYAGNNNMYQLGLASGKVGWWIGGSLPSSQYDPNTLSTNTWYHLAWVKDGTSYKIYKDGTQVASFTNSATIQSHEWRIGNTYDGATQGMTGYIENFQILHGIAKYTSNFTPPTQTQGRAYQAS